MARKSGAAEKVRRAIWPTIVRVVPFEAGFLHYLILRITSVGITTCGLGLVVIVRSSS